jgi:type IV pilus assembly protein PilE
MSRTTLSKRGRGFSLIELLTVMAVATILIAVAVPAFNSQIRKSRRTEARTALLDLAARAERMYATTNSYINSTTSELDPSDLGYSGSWPITVGSGYYTVSDPTSTATQFTFKATPTGTQTKDTECAAFEVDNTGKQSSIDSGGSDTTDTCWH